MRRWWPSAFLSPVHRRTARGLPPGHPTSEAIRKQFDITRNPAKDDTSNTVPHAYSRPPTAACRLPPATCYLPTADCRLLTAKRYPLPAAC